MDKELFLKLINDLQDTFDYWKDIHKVNFSHNCISTMQPHKDCAGSLVELMDRVSPDPKNEWISWFVYEADFGRSSCNRIVINNKEYFVTSAEVMWDVLQKMILGGEDIQFDKKI